ncbi:CDP-diacylglycerol--serine O-phosphatidyltransferase [Zophobihabitans entericus]|uniref:CDP-diacylglycerol--serine O-phosphatidyltransferase n=1 Tax=Zophobihabitans entericus TaxID=1635327 RepID=A0A6G9ICN9_9GAMM|nr:CDP-diacylglycerol--serine O-phosphatidyltransferase [Zophobihabitans entericus]QIQ21607.1 CDP-diacylglycerol--serine O-phosphatidyltransferase [Zophobihabitans entericus]
MRIPFFKYNHQKHLDELPKLKQSQDEFRILLSPSEYRIELLKAIESAKHRIYIIALYLEKDEAGQEVLEALYQAKKSNPQLDIKIFVDWHRAQRGRIGEGPVESNANYYHKMQQKYPDIHLDYYGVPVNRREMLGVLHLKGSIIDNTLLYTGASINNVYLHKLDKYRFDRYHLITNKALTDSMVNYVDQHLITASAIQKLDNPEQPSRKQIKPDIKQLRWQLSQNQYQYKADADNNELAVSPIIGLGRNNDLNQMIHHLINCTQHKATFCTPYFNLPAVLIKDIIRLLKKGKQVEIIIGDKTANDFYIPEDQPFNISGGLPYLYEVNLRNFITRLQHFIDKGLLTVRLWKDEDHTYHLKGIWIDNNWVMITGNNLNPRAWRLDLENAVLIHDPHHQLQSQFEQELESIRKHTFLVTHYQQIQASQFYPKHVHKLIKRLSRIRVDRIIKRLL